MKIVITGASGFLGHHLSHYLYQRGHQVFPLVRSSEKANIFEKNGMHPCIGDVGDRQLLQSLLSGADVVFHLAALFNNPESSWEDYYRVNVEGVRLVLEVAKACGVSRVIHCSTVGVSSGDGLHASSESAPYSPPENDKYEKTKCEGEKVALDFFRKEGLPIVVIRPAQVYGPGDVRKAKFYRMVKKGVLVGSGNNWKHLVYIDDMSRAFELAMLNEQAVGQVFIIAGENPVLLKDLVHIVAKALGVDLPKLYLPAVPITLLCTLTEIICNRVGVKPPLFRRSMDFFTKSVQFDVTKAHKLLGFKSEVDVRTGIASTAAWYKNNGFL